MLTKLDMHAEQLIQNELAKEVKNNLGTIAHGFMYPRTTSTYEVRVGPRTHCVWVQAFLYSLTLNRIKGLDRMGLEHLRETHRQKDADAN